MLPIINLESITNIAQGNPFIVAVPQTTPSLRPLSLTAFLIFSSYSGKSMGFWLFKLPSHSTKLSLSVIIAIRSIAPILKYAPHWGQIIELLKNTECLLVFLHLGQAISSSLFRKLNIFFNSITFPPIYLLLQMKIQHLHRVFHQHIRILLQNRKENGLWLFHTPFQIYHPV